ncbi:ABC transporter permease [Opitutus terrae]|uniref:Permease n=1 Tax=Opitutus terrae (strain DSM 11246 / JCM 15787 / PB90-1) TaxID=452637 RepID=B1ZXV4_OPITP|nr:ABC transporter permease [Opitutus terrae]ACB75156.1 permease [Opitutus terrae PB90-1]
MLSDLRYAFRQLLKSPGFTAVAVITLAVGIAGTAAVFTVVKSLLLDPLPYPEGDRIGQIWTKSSGSHFDFKPLSTPDLLDIQEQVGGLEAVGAFSPRRYTLGGDQPESVEGAYCTPGVFSTLKVPPLLGRWFSADDVAGQDGAAVAIISHSLWQSRFAGRPDCIGRTLRLDGRNVTIVGVMPPGFELLSLWTRERRLQIFLPLVLRHQGASRGDYWLASLARLKPGVSASQADAELGAVAAKIRQSTPDADPRKEFWFMPLQQGLGGLPALRISVLLAAGWTLLVLAAQNVASMMLARGISRQSEIAVRVALGASRLRIIRLVLAESILLALLASGAGFLLTLWGLDALRAALPAAVMPRAGLVVDGWLLGCIGLLAVFVVQAAGLTPALLASKTDVVSGLKEAGVNHTSARKTQRRLRRLVIGQIALAQFLVSIAMQLSGTYQQMVAGSRAMISDQVVTSAVVVRGTQYSDATRVAFWDRFLAAVQAQPGVSDAAVTTKLPLNGGISMPLLTDQESYDPASPRPYVEVSYISPQFFAALNARLLQGRPLTEQDSAVPRSAVVINRTMAQRYWPGQNPIGHHLRPAQSGETWSGQIVGVVEDIRQFAERPAKPEAYFAYSDSPWPEGFLVVRSRAGLPVPVDSIRAELARLDPDLALADVKSMRNHFDDSGRVLAIVTSVVDALTVGILALAALGLYGTLSFTFARRRRDIGVRVAFGAAPRDIATLVVRQALAWVALGGVIGALGSWLIAKAVGAMLADATPLSLPQLAASVATVLAAAALASWLPAHRATRLNPIDALRAE